MIPTEAFILMGTLGLSAEQSATIQQMLSMVETATRTERSPGAVRQERYRERRKASQPVTLASPSVTSDAPPPDKEAPHTPKEINPLPRSSSVPSDDLFGLPSLSVTPVAKPAKPKRAAKSNSDAGAIRRVLEAVLTGETAQAVIDHRNKTVKAPLTVRAAENLAKAFAATGQPEAAANMMINRSWRGFEPDWFWRDAPREKGQSGGDERVHVLNELRRRRAERDGEVDCQGGRTEHDAQPSKFARSYEHQEAGGPS